MNADCNRKTLNEDLLEAVMRGQRFIKDSVETLLKKYGICITEFGVLEAIYALGPMPIQKIAERVLVTSGSMTYTVGRMVEKELIERKVSSKDGRQFILTLTEKGRVLIEETLEKHNELIDEIFKEIDDSNMKNLISGLSNIRE